MHGMTIDALTSHLGVAAFRQQTHRTEQHTRHGNRHLPYSENTSCCLGCVTHCSPSVFPRLRELTQPICPLPPSCSPSPLPDFPNKTPVYILYAFINWSSILKKYRTIKEQSLNLTHNHRIQKQVSCHASRSKKKETRKDLETQSPQAKKRPYRSRFYFSSSHTHGFYRWKHAAGDQFLSGAQSETGHRIRQRDSATHNRQFFSGGWSGKYPTALPPW